MEEQKYWNRLSRRQVSRRRLITGAALTGGGLAAAGVVGCGDNGSGTAEPEDTGSTGGRELPPDAETIVDARRATTLPPDDQRGGTVRFQGFDPVVLDRFDPHQTQFGPMYANQSSVFSKLYMYRSHEEPTWDNILPDLASVAPEMIGDPNAPTTYVIKLRQGVKFHDNEKSRRDFPNVAGRELTAEDIVYNYTRQANTESYQKGYYYRRSQYATIDKIVATDKYTVRIDTKGPIAPFYHFMADTNAMIIPKEVVDNDPVSPGGPPRDTIDTNTPPPPADRMIGTGPFFWGDLKFGIEYKAVRNPEWFGWDDPDLGRPYLDGYTVSGSSLNDNSLESLFRQKKIDGATFIDNPDWIYQIKNEMPELQFLALWVSGWIGTRFKLHCKPFDDVRVRKAIHLATERQQILDVIGRGEWKMQGPVGQAISYWALPYDELLTLPGYRQNAQGRDQDITDALALYDAAGRPEIPQIWFANLPGYIPNFIGSWKRFMGENLGIPADQLRTQTQSYGRIAEALTDDGCGDLIPMYWGFDNGWIDLDDWVYPYFHSTGSKNSFRLNDPELDLLLDGQRAEFDIDKRRELGFTIQRYLLGLEGDGLQKGAHARIDYAAPYLVVVLWPYLKNAALFPWFGSSYWSSNTWLDKSDPSFQGRPA